VTTFHLNTEGRKRLTEHAAALLAAISAPGKQDAQPLVEVTAGAATEEEWID